MKSPFLLVAALAIIGAWGCGSKDTRYHAATIPVKGTLLIDGKSFGPCVIFFAAVNQDPDPNKWIPTVTGQVKEDGSFVLSTYNQGDGAPAGAYGVSLGPDAANLLAKVPKCKAIEIEIQKSNAEVMTLEVKLEANN